LSRQLQEALDGGRLGKGHGLLRQVEALDLGAGLTGPVNVSCKSHEGLIDLDTAYTRAAAQGGVKYLNGLHF